MTLIVLMEEGAMSIFAVSFFARPLHNLFLQIIIFQSMVPKSLYFGDTFLFAVKYMTQQNHHCEPGGMMNSSNLTDARSECSRDSSCIMFYEERKGGSFQSSLSNSSFYNCTASTTIKQGCRQNDILYKKGNINN